MSEFNPMLMQLVRQRLAEKRAFMPPGGDPAAGGAAPPGAPPPGAAPPPGDPMAAAPPPPGMPAAPPPGTPAGQPPALPGAAAAPPGVAAAPPGAAPQPAQQKIKPEQWMQMLDFRLYNMQQQLTAIMNHTGVTLPPDVLILPPGSPAAPPPETAMQGGEMDPGQAPAQPQGQGAIQPIQPMEGAAPQQDPAAGGGGPPKTAALSSLTSLINYYESAETQERNSRPVSYIGEPFMDESVSVPTKAAALATLFRQAAAGDPVASRVA